MTIFESLFIQPQSKQDYDRVRMSLVTDNPANTSDCSATTKPATGMGPRYVISVIKNEVRKEAGCN